MLGADASQPRRCSSPLPSVVLAFRPPQPAPAQLLAHLRRPVSNMHTPRRAEAASGGRSKVGVKVARAFFCVTQVGLRCWLSSGPNLAQPTHICAHRRLARERERAEAQMGDAMGLGWCEAARDDLASGLLSRLPSLCTALSETWPRALAFSCRWEQGGPFPRNMTLVAGRLQLGQLMQQTAAHGRASIICCFTAECYVCRTLHPRLTKLAAEHPEVWAHLLASCQRSQEMTLQCSAHTRRWLLHITSDEAARERQDCAC